MDPKQYHLLLRISEESIEVSKEAIKTIRHTNDPQKQREHLIRLHEEMSQLTVLYVTLLDQAEVVKPCEQTQLLCKEKVLTKLKKELAAHD